MSALPKVTMPEALQRWMTEATRLTRMGKLTEATKDHSASTGAPAFRAASGIGRHPRR